MIAKKIILLGLIALPMQVFSDVTTDNVVQLGVDQQPNSYDFTGTTLKISYSTTGIDGKAHFSYKNGKNILNFQGEEIRTVETEIGTLVSVTVSKPVDRNSVSFSVLIPKVNLDSKLKSSLTTRGFLTFHKFSQIPSFNTGQLDTSQVYSLIGTAKSVIFQTP